MNILILHRVPYARIEYHRGIDHNLHQVTYFGKQAAIDSLPPALRCSAVVRAGAASAFEEASAWMSQYPQRFDRIISLSEYELLDAAQLREAFAVEGPSVREVTLVRHKVHMKEAVARQGLRVPHFMPMASFIDRPQSTPWAGKTVIKPHSGASSVDVEIHPNPLAALERAAQQLASRRWAVHDFQVEEYIEGPLRHFDGLVQDGQLLALVASEYVGTCLAYMAQGAPLGSVQLETDARQWQWVERVLSAVEITQGAFHLEAIVDADEPVFLEVGNRVGGADVVATFEMATGIHLPSLELRILTDAQPVQPWLPKQAITPGFGWFAFAGHTQHPATFNGLVGAEPFRSSAAVVQWHELPYGSALPAHVTYSAHEAPLTGIVQHGDAAQTRAWLQQLFATVVLAKDNAAVA